MTNNGEKKSHPVTSWCKLNSILKSSGHENDFMILRLLSKVKLLPEIRIEKVLSVSLFHFFLQLIKHKAQRKKSNLSNYNSKTNYLLTSWEFFYSILLPLARAQLPLDSGPMIMIIMIIQPSSRNVEETKARWLYFNILLQVVCTYF